MDMLKKVLDYVKMIKGGTRSNMDAAGLPLPAGNIGGSKSDHRFPEMLQIAEAWDSLQKLELESVLREYLSAHYSEQDADTGGL